jgi:hypothetical protein
MSTFQTATAVSQPLDPLKRVNYTFGLVLGVDEFEQEQIYFRAKEKSHTRLLHGYGTDYGLAVSVGNDGTPNVEVRVACGVAVNPQGQEIHVPRTMCARINDWLTKYNSALQSIFGNPPLPLSLCVVLCYRECLTDEVPVPGEPCRTQSDSMAPSHIAEEFELKLCLDPDTFPLSPPIDLSALPAGLSVRPTQAEEEAERDFRELLQRIQISNVASQYITQQQLDDMVRQLAAPESITSIPSGGPTVYIHPADAPEMLRHALLVWVTEVRPALNAIAPVTPCDEPQEQCVLLARLNFSVGNIWQVLGSITIDESDRPFLVQTRLLQEAALLGLLGEGAASSSASSSVVAAGVFQISGATATAVGPIIGQLTAKNPGALPPGGFLLNWAGDKPYTNPLGSLPNLRMYVVKGTPYLSSIANREIFEVLAFRADGILVRILDTTGGTTAAGFMVEITEITAGT